MPRPQRELDPNGGAQVAFARDLRALREQAGSPKFATMERRVGRSKSTLAEAAGGRHLPRWDTVADFVRACGADPAPWRPRWEQLRRELGVPTAELTDSEPLAQPGQSGAELTPAGQDAPEEAAESTAPAAPGRGDGFAEVHPAGETRGTDLTATSVPSPEPGTAGPGTVGGAEARADGGFARRAPERGGRRRALVLAVAAAGAAILLGMGFLIGRFTGPEVAGPDVRAIEVQNKIALGADLLVEDRTPVYLSTIPISYCAAADRNCKVAGTDMLSGAAVVAHCSTHGQEMHNYNLDEAASASNPDRATSDLWYRASFPNGRTGFISEVYLTASSRGGLGLPDCGPGVAATVPVTGG